MSIRNEKKKEFLCLLEMKKKGIFMPIGKQKRAKQKNAQLPLMAICP